MTSLNKHGKPNTQLGVGKTTGVLAIKSRVLLLIDRYGIFKPLASHLRVHGFIVFSTENPDDIENIIRLHQLDAIVLEDELRGTSAETILEKARKSGFTQPVILLTRNGPNEKFTTVLKVPFNLPELLEALA